MSVRKGVSARRIVSITLCWILEGLLATTEAVGKEIVEWLGGPGIPQSIILAFWFRYKSMVCYTSTHSIYKGTHFTYQCIRKSHLGRPKVNNVSL
jgi:hypothetical protein